MSPLHPLRWRWLAPVPASCLLLTTIGLLYASGVFVAEFDSPAYTTAIGLAFLTTDLALTLFSTLLHHTSLHAPPALYPRIPPLLSLLAALLLVPQAFIPRALDTANHALLFAAAAALGLACGATYVTGLSVLQSWVPDALPFINALGMLFVSLGSFFGIFFIQATISLFGSASRALVALAVIQVAVIFFASPLLSSPPRGWHPDWETAPSDNPKEETPILAAQQPSIDEEAPEPPASKPKPQPSNKDPIQGLSGDVSMSISDVLRTPSLYPFTLAIVAIIGPGTGLAMSFPHMMAVLFGTKSAVASSWFTWVLVGGLAGRFAAGFVLEMFGKQSPDRTGFFASRTATLLFLSLQSACLILMPVAADFGLGTLYSVLAMLVYFSFSAGMVSSICLSRSMFTAFNSSLTFNIGGFLTGMVELLYSVIIARTNDRKGALLREPGVEAPGFGYFFAFSILLSVSGTLACLKLSECKKAYYQAGLESHLTPTAQKE